MFNLRSWGNLTTAISLIRLVVDLTTFHGCRHLHLHLWQVLKCSMCPCREKSPSATVPPMPRTFISSSSNITLLQEKRPWHSDILAAPASALPYSRSSKAAVKASVIQQLDSVLSSSRAWSLAQSHQAWEQLQSTNTSSRACWLYSSHLKSISKSPRSQLCSVLDSHSVACDEYTYNSLF